MHHETQPLFKCKFELKVLTTKYKWVSFSTKAIEDLPQSLKIEIKLFMVRLSFQSMNIRLKKKRANKRVKGGSRSRDNLNPKWQRCIYGIVESVMTLQTALQLLSNFFVRRSNRPLNIVMLGCCLSIQLLETAPSLALGPIGRIIIFTLLWPRCSIRAPNASFWHNFIKTYKIIK